MNNIQQRNILLAATSLICITLLIGRICIYSSFNYIFLIWNLFLAWIPLYFSEKLSHYEKENKNWMIVPLFFSWLVFFPNAPYIITDLFHLKPHSHVPVWFDLILIISFAWNGLLLGFISLMEVHKTLLKMYSNKISWLIVVSILFLSGYGIYLGRFERWNSWDIVTHPFRLFSHMFENFFDPDVLPRLMGVTLSFGLFLSIGYMTIYFLSNKYEEAK